MPSFFRCILPLAALTFSLHAADWPNYRGPHHNGISDEKGWNATFGTTPPKVLWSAEVGLGFSTFAVADGRVYTTGNEKNTDTVFCFDATTGKLIWSHPYPADLGDKFFEGGTTGTPSVSDGRVYQLSRWGDVFCFDAATGKVIWNKNVQTETGATVPDWGFGGSPLVAGDKVILNVGESGMALNKADGKIDWQSGTESAGYSTPVPVTKDDRSLVVFANGKAFQEVEVSSGSQLWQYPWPTRYGVNAADPVIAGPNEIFVSSGYNRGCALLRLAPATPPEVVWQNKELRTQMNPAVLVKGFLYGIDNDQNARAMLKCVELATGAVKWTAPEVGFGSVTVADGKLIVLSAKGELYVADVSAEKFAVISHAPILTGKCWSAPVLANGRLYARNSTGNVVCLDMKGK